MNHFGSDEYYRRAVGIPGRSCTRSKEPGRFFDVGRGPLYAAYARGAIITDVDGNDYIDMLCALGAISLGYGTRAKYPISCDDTVCSLPYAFEADAAETVLRHVAPWATTVRFTRTGSEATHAAYRVAKAATGRELVLIGDWAYHGWHEWCSTAPLMKDVLSSNNRYVWKYPHGMDFSAFEARWKEFDGIHVAAVFVEPHRWEAIDCQWLKRLRTWCTEHGALLVFDEMIYGGRWALGGATEHFGVVPDLACYGKALGNGEAVAFVVGRDVLREHGQMVSGTFSGDARALAALCDTVHRYVIEPVVPQLWDRGQQLWNGLRELVDASAFAGRAHVEGNPVHYRLRFDEPTLGREFAAQMAARGVLWHPDVGNIMYAHTPQHIEAVLAAAHGSLIALAEAASYGHGV